MDLGRYSKILKNKKIMLFLLIYLVFLSVTVYLFKLGSPPKGEVDVYKGVIHGDKTGFFWAHYTFFSAIHKGSWGESHGK